jgi:hypothetical protein
MLLNISFLNTFCNHLFTFKDMHTNSTIHKQKTVLCHSLQWFLRPCDKNFTLPIQNFSFSIKLLASIPFNFRANFCTSVPKRSVNKFRDSVPGFFSHANRPLHFMATFLSIFLYFFFSHKIKCVICPGGGGGKRKGKYF